MIWIVSSLSISPCFLLSGEFLYALSVIHQVRPFISAWLCNDLTRNISIPSNFHTHPLSCDIWSYHLVLSLRENRRNDGGQHQTKRPSSRDEKGERIRRRIPWTFSEGGFSSRPTEYANADSGTVDRPDGSSIRAAPNHWNGERITLEHVSRQYNERSNTIQICEARFSAV